MQFSSTDLEESIDVVSRVYCDHELQLDHRSKALKTTLSTVGQPSLSSRFCSVDLAYGARVRVDAGRLPNLYLFMHCRQGRGVVAQHQAKMAWLPNSTLPVSANLQTGFDFDEQFAQTSFPVEAAYLNGLCSRLLGYRPDQEVRFALRPFPQSMYAPWLHLMGLVRTLPSDAPLAAQEALREYVVTTLLTQLPHNLTEALSNPDKLMGHRASVQTVHQAHDYILAHLDNPLLAVSDIAQAIGVSMRVLQYAFRVHKQTTPLAYLRDLRLQEAHEQLIRLASDPESALSAGTHQIGQVAMQCGFFHLGRFAQYYKVKFGQLPSQTLKRTANQ